MVNKCCNLMIFVYRINVTVFFSHSVCLSVRSCESVRTRVYVQRSTSCCWRKTDVISAYAQSSPKHHKCIPTLRWNGRIQANPISFNNCIKTIKFLCNCSEYWPTVKMLSFAQCTVSRQLVMNYWLMIHISRNRVLAKYCIQKLQATNVF